MKVELSTKVLNLKHTWSIARGSADSKHYHYFKIEHEGIVGWGEAAHNVRYGESLETIHTVLETAKETLESDPEAVHSWQTWVPNLSKDQAAARAAVDIACRDWVTRSEQKPFFKTVSSEGMVTSFSIGIDSPEAIRDKVEEAEAFRVLKIKLGTPQDRDIVESVRQVTDKPLRVDANEGWETREEALEMVEWLASRGVELIEQPMPAGRFDDVAWLREQSPLPIVADEDVCGLADIDQLAGVYDGINVKLMKAGGATPGAAMLEKARALGLKTMLGCMIESSVGITAAAFLAAEVDWIDLDGNLLIADDPFSGVTCSDGLLYLPTGNGLCVTETRDATHEGRGNSPASLH